MIVERFAAAAKRAAVRTAESSCSMQNSPRNAISVSFVLLVIACGTSEQSTGIGLGGQANLGGASAANTGGLATTGGNQAAVTNGAGGGSSSHSTTSATQGGSSLAGASSAGGMHTGGNSTIATTIQGSATGGASTSTQSTSAATGGVTLATGGRATGGSPTGGRATTAASAGATHASGGAALGGATSSSAGGTASGGRASGGSANGGQGTGGASTTASNELLVPASGALLGLFTPAQTDSELKTAEAQIGRKVAIHLGYFDWSNDYASFAQTDIAAGRIPYVTIEPWNTTLDAIASGTEDATIRNRAAAVASLKGKLLLRFAHEMNGNWYPWDGYHNGASAAAPPKYVAAYRHIHDLFASAGVTNVLWVFCPNVDSVPSDAWNQWSNYYPGDSYVDWMCYDGYNWGTDTFASMTSRIYSGLSTKNKPILLGETSTQDIEKANWISAIVPAMKSQFPLIKGLVWFDVDKEQDWRYDSTSSSLSAFVTMAKDPYFNP